MQRLKIGSGDPAIFKTVAHMQNLTLGKEGVGHPLVRAAAVEAARGAVKNLTEIEHVLAWVKKNIEFRGEYAETLQSPMVTLQLKAGDCDDHSTLIAAMLRSLGYNASFKTVATSGMDPQRFSHVYVIAQDKRTGQWIPIDSTVPQSFAGWEPPMIYRSKIYPFPPTSRRAVRRLRSLAGLGDGDQTFQPLVPFPSAPEGLSPGAQFAYNIAEPITQAFASQIAHGTTPAASLTGNLNLGMTGAQTPVWVWFLLGGGLLWLVSRR